MHLHRIAFAAQHVDVERTVIVRRSADGAAHDVLPSPWSSRSRVHEYGGGSFTAAGDIVYFVEDREQRVMSCRLDGSAPAALTAPSYISPRPSRIRLRMVTGVIPCKAL